ncbi:beta-galactoside alpha-2,6-sialyltransferase 2-like [Micropterus dolomieu]|uniref:beta-galactoside alpha-2,6-sialyltransferase 2-like n=1 Tax=Micropterus dolomieu TaxID=147949 RepID=UPI001E8D4B15|nr:beta-galactoside alpha-2,6-sialyltransferase 2-like [Micropterus dolomieu]
MRTSVSINANVCGYFAFMRCGYEKKGQQQCNGQHSSSAPRSVSLCTERPANRARVLAVQQGEQEEKWTAGQQQHPARTDTDFKGPVICWRTHGYEEIEASVEALQLTSGLSPVCGALLLVGQLNWRVCELEHPDTRRLASIQAPNQQHANLGLRPELASPLTTTYPRVELEPSASSTTPEPSLDMSLSPNSAPYAIYVSQEASHQDYLDQQSLAAWSSFGTENVGSHSDPVVQSRERTSQITEDQNHVSTTRYHGGEEEDDDRENEELGNRMRTTADRRAGDDSSDLEQYYFSKSLSVVQRLWQGRVSASMLSPRLQRAMKDYMSANKHHVSYKGHRRVARSAKELLCQIKAQAQLSTVDGSEKPFSSLGWAGLVPSLPLEQLFRQQDQSSFKNCAVVTSAGAILRSGLGKEIDCASTGNQTALSSCCPSQKAALHQTPTLCSFEL